MGVFPPSSRNVILFSLLLTALTIRLSRSEPAKCPNGWEIHGEFCYLLNTTSKLSWSGARESCRGDLVYIKSREEKDFVQNLTGSSPEGSWIGLSKNKSKPVRSFNSKDDLGYRQACFVVNAREIQRERPCKHTFSSICVSRGSSNCTQGWEKFEQHCYLAVLDNMTWPRAHANCLKKNAELITCSNVTIKVLKKLFNGTSQRDIWNGFKIMLAYENPTQGWNWINGTKFNGLKNWSVLVNDPLYGWSCANLYQGEVNLWQNCLTNHSFICKMPVNKTCPEHWTNNGSSCYLFSRNKLSWKEARINCTAQHGHLLSFFNSSDETFIQDYLKNESCSEHYWLGLNRNRGNRTICGLKEHNHSMPIFHNRSINCSAAAFSSASQTATKRYCSKQLPLICIAKKINSTDCQSGWIIIGSSCFLVVQNFNMNWDLSQKYCFEKNATLAHSRVFLNNNISKLSLSKTVYWIETKVFNATNNPTKGWVWVDGRNLNESDGLGKVYLPYTGYEKRCAGIKGNGTWFGKSCSESLSFVCKTEAKEVTLQTLYTRIEVLSEILKNNEGNESQTINAEEIITTFADNVNAILQNDNFNTSMNISIGNIDLDILIKSLKELERLKSSTAEVQYLPLSSIQHICRNISTCIVKRAIIKIKNIPLNASPLLKDKNESAFEVADVISIDVYANKDKIGKLRDSISIKFERKNGKLGNPNCVYLESGGWSKNGMKTGESNGNTVNCITNHFSSFAMVVIDAEENSGHKKAFAYISYIGSGLSLIGLSITLLCYVVLHKDLQVLNSTRHLVHLNLQLSLGLIQIIFLAGAGKTDDKVVCKMVAILLHYFSLASFCWMLLEGTMLYLKVISVFRGTVVGIKSFHVFGWGFPLFFVGIAVLVKSDAYGTDKWCWLSYDYGYFWVFFAPVILVTTLNLAILIAVMKVIFRVSKSTSCNAKANILTTLRGLIILFPVLGMSWVFSIISVNHDALVWKYCFAIFNSLQGFLVFFIYGVCNQEIRHSLKRRLGRGGIDPSSTGQVQVTPVESKM